MAATGKEPVTLSQLKTVLSNSSGSDSVAQIVEEHNTSKTAHEDIRGLVGQAKATADDAVKKAGEAITKTPYVGDNGNWFVYSGGVAVDSKVSARGAKGENGKSAYQSAVDGGFSDNETNFNTQIASIGDVSSVLDEINGNGTIKYTPKIVFVTNAVLWGANLGRGFKYLVPNEGAWSSPANVGDLVVLCEGDVQTHAPEMQVPYSNGDVYKVARIGIVNQASNGVILEDNPIANIGGSGNAGYEYSQTDLEAGVSELAEGKLYFVYE